MLNRRNLLLASIAAGVAMPNRTALAKASQPMTPVNFDVPAGACDCHTHIHGDPEKFPFFAGRVYTPETALPEEMAALHKSLHIRSRGDRHAERLRYRQFRDTVWHEGTWRGCSRRCGHRRKDAGNGA